MAVIQKSISMIASSSSLPSSPNVSFLPRAVNEGKKKKRERERKTNVPRSNNQPTSHSIIWSSKVSQSVSSFLHAAVVWTRKKRESSGISPPSLLRTTSVPPTHSFFLWSISKHLPPLRLRDHTKDSSNHCVSNGRRELAGQPAD